MKIEKIASRVKCDIASCGKLANYTVFNGMGLARNINLCDECAKELHFKLSQLFVPKSPKNIVAKAANQSAPLGGVIEQRKSGGKK